MDIRAANLSIGYGEKIVCKHLDFTVPSGELTCLIGENGAGKSTLLKSMAGLLPFLAGDIYLSEKPMGTYKRNELAKIMAIVLTQRISVDFLTAIEVVSMGRYPHTGFLGKLSQKDKSLAEDSLALTGAKDLMHRIFATLSDGEKQKVLIARAITQEPRIMLLDEPTTHLDIKHKLEVMDLLNRLAKDKGMTIVLSLHELDLAVKSCRHIIALKNEGILFEGAPEKLETNDTVNQLFGMAPGRFSYATGNAELFAGASDNVFVLSGQGTGILVYRMLARRRIGFTTGILESHDCEFSVASSMGAKIFLHSEDTALEDVMVAIDKAETVIDTGCPCHSRYSWQERLLKTAIASKANLISFRCPTAFEKAYGKTRTVFVKDIGELEKHL